MKPYTLKYESSVENYRGKSDNESLLMGDNC